MHSIWVFLFVLALAPLARAEPKAAKEDAFSSANLQLEAAAVEKDARGLTIVQVVAEVDHRPSRVPAIVQGRLEGQTYSAALVRGVLASLADTGDYAELDAQREQVTGGLRIRLRLVSRQIVSALRIVGGALDEPVTADIAGIGSGDEVTEADLPVAAAKVVRYYQTRGYPEARVTATWEHTPGSRRVIVTLAVVSGPVAVLARRDFVVRGPDTRVLRGYFDSYAVAVGAHADEEALAQADRQLETLLRARGWFTAAVQHRVLSNAAETALEVTVQTGPRVSIRFENNHTVDVSDLRRALTSDETRTVDAALAKIEEYYVTRGYFDVRVRFHETQSLDGSESDWLFTILEGDRLRVASRRYPCLSGERTHADVDAEVDAMLGEQLPGGTEILTPPAPGALEEFWNATQTNAPLVEPSRSSPWTVFTPRTYQTALDHLRDLYRSEGYLSAVVGPVTLLRRACDPHSAPGACIPLGQRVTPTSVCPNVEQPIPTEDETAPQLTCREDPLKGRYCEPNAVISIPIKLGPRTILWDVEFQGNRGVVDGELLPIAALELGSPLSQLALQQARRRVLERYQDEGYAFAQVDVDLDLSDDHSRGRARFAIAERERVTVKGFVIRGAKNTNETLIRERLELVVGGLFRRQWARRSEEQLALLGVFSTVTVSLEDPDVPAREKVVVVQVEEQAPQYVEVRPGFSTGEGPRLEVGYTHRNLFGQAVLLRFRAQVGYLPDFLILDADVRKNFESLSFVERLERRNSLTLEFPVAKLYRLAIDGIDVRDNSRDYGITKEAAIATLTFRPSREVTFLLGGGGEHNDVHILKSRGDLSYELARLLAYPDGKSFALALRGGVIWDGTDNALGPTRGAGASLDVEPVIAFVAADKATVKLNSCTNVLDPSQCEFRSRFIKIANRISGYIPFNDKGLTLALSLRWGVNIQLISRSVTYTDRLFFLGGGESLRGHLQASVIPQDIAEQLAADKNSSDPNAVSTEKIGLRAGDFMINPKIELRIPLTDVFQTAIFLDTGNLWRDIRNVVPYRLRYSIGTGVRVMTPVGPLALDYGFKLDRREWEPDIGALHFSLGWF